MKLLLFILFIFLGGIVYSQDSPYGVDQTWGSANTMNFAKGAIGAKDGFWFIQQYTDTTEANNFSPAIRNIAGFIIRVNSTELWIRNELTTAWVRVGSGSITGGANGVSSDGNNIILGGTALDRYTPITFNGFPLTLVHDGIAASTITDSSSITVANRTASTSVTDSFTTPRYEFSFNARKSNPPSQGSKNIRFYWQGTGANYTASFLGLYSSVEGLHTNRNLFSIDALGKITTNLNIGGVYYGQNGSNPIIGSSTNLENSTSSTNIAFGLQSSTAMTTGSENVAIGTSTLSSNTVGEENVAIGYNSLAVNDTNYNTAVGAYSLLSNTTGDQNSAFGKNAGLNNTIGVKNSFLGTASGENNTTGSFNTPVGHDAMLQNTTGSENSSLGHLSWPQNVTGNYNVGIGNSSGRSISHGNQNIFIGRYAGFNASQNDSVDNDIAIGFGVYTTKSNQILIGNTSHTETILHGIDSAGTSVDSVVVKTTGDVLKLVAQSSIVGVTPTLQQVSNAGNTTGIQLMAGSFKWDSTFAVTPQSGTGVVGFGGGNTSFYTWSTSAGTLPGYRFQTVSSDGSLSAVPLVIYNGNVGIGNTAPAELLSIGTAGSSQATASMSGGTSGKITITTKAAAGTYTLTLPDNDGNAGEFLQTDGSGNTSWNAHVEEDIAAINALGSPWLAETYGISVAHVGAAVALADGQLVFMATYLEKGQTVTGVKFYQSVTGNFTGDNNNKVGLYSYSGGTLTLVASSASDENIWKASTNTYQTVAFSSPYVATAGIYFVGLLYNNSAQVTAPSIGASGTLLLNAAVGIPGLTNSAKLYCFLNGQTDLVASQAMSGLTTTNRPYYVALY